MRKGTSRRQCVPPVLLRDAEEPLLEGTAILSEFSGDLALLLWMAFRDVMFWSTTPPDARENLFSRLAALRRRLWLGELKADPKVKAALEFLTEILTSPTSADAELMGLACEHLSDWALAENGTETAIGFAQAAFLANPRVAERAVNAGLLAIRLGRRHRGETWLRQGIVVARRSRSWEPYSQAYIGLGRIYFGEGAVEDAEKHFTMAARAARRHGLPEVRSRALHGLFQIALQRGDIATAERLARVTLRGIGKRHPEYMKVMHDLASAWVEEGEHKRAMAVLQQLVPGRVALHERMRTQALLARAASGAGDAATAGAAYLSAMQLINKLEASADSVHALLDLAQAQRLLGDYRLGRSTGRRARSMAEELELPDLVRQADTILRLPPAGGGRKREGAE